MNESKTFTFTKLNNDNYVIWEDRMASFLREHDLWQVIAQERPQYDEQWQMKDGRVRAFIVLALEDDQINHVYGKPTAAEMWQALKYIHNPFLTKVCIIKEINASKMKSSQNMNDHINEMSDLFKKLIDLGETELSDEWKVKFLLASSPENYKNVVLELGEMPDKDLLWSEVCAKLLEEFECKKRPFASGVENGIFGAEQSVNQHSPECKCQNKFNVRNIN